MIRPVSSQLADFLRLGPTPPSSDEVGYSAVNRRVASSNLAPGTQLLCHAVSCEHIQEIRPFDDEMSSARTMINLDQ
jgi:hypothetical protein